MAQHDQRGLYARWVPRVVDAETRVVDAHNALGQIQISVAGADVLVKSIPSV